MNPMSPLVHLVDDDDAVRDALALLLSTVGLRVTGWAHPQQFLQQFDREAIGAIVLDMRLPAMSGLALLETLRASGADQPVILLTGHGTVDLCRRAFKSGATEFLEKPVADEVLLDAVQAAVRSHSRSRERDQAQRTQRERFARLSERERDVLRLVIEGQTAKQMARALDLSPRTVETHRANLGAKLEVTSLAQLVRQYAALLEP